MSINLYFPIYPSIFRFIFAQEPEKQSYKVRILLFVSARLKTNQVTRQWHTLETELTSNLAPLKG